MFPHEVLLESQKTLTKIKLFVFSSYLYSVSFSICCVLVFSLYIYLSEIGMLDCWPTALCHLTKQAPLRIKAEALFQVKAEGIRGELEIKAMMIT